MQYEFPILSFQLSVTSLAANLTAAARNSKLEHEAIARTTQASPQQGRDHLFRHRARGQQRFQLRHPGHRSKETEDPTLRRDLFPNHSRLPLCGRRADCLQPRGAQIVGSDPRHQLRRRCVQKQISKRLRLHHLLPEGLQNRGNGLLEP